LISSFPLAPFLTSELWQNFNSFKSQIDSDKNLYFGNIGEMLKDQRLASIAEIRSLIKSKEEDIEMDIFVRK